MHLIGYVTPIKKTLSELQKKNGEQMTTTKKICPACTGHGGVWTGHGDATQCDVCDGWGHLLLNVCVECEREFDLANEIDETEWLFGHDCEP